MVQTIVKICNKSLIEKTLFDSIFLKTLQKFYSFLKAYIVEADLKGNSDVMAFLMHISNAVNIRNIFKYTREPRFDFMKYYENVSKTPVDILA